MTKRKIKEEIKNSDWVHELENLNINEAISWLQNIHPRCGILEYDVGDYYVDSSITSYRDETDEEYATRLAVEAEVKAANKRKEDAKKKSDAEKMGFLITNNALLYAFRKKYEGHPKLDDMENLFIAVTRMEWDGAPVKKIKLVQDCLDRMTNN